MSRRIKPHKVLGRELGEIREKDPDGRIVVHHRTVDTLGKMLRSGTMTQEMHDAAKDFQGAFIVANLDPIRALPILQVPGTGREPDLNERQLDARRRVHEALQALGGISSPAGSCVWHVVGLQRSVREWAIRQGWGGRSVRQEQAQGSWWQRLGCWRRTSGMASPSAPLDTGACAALDNDGLPIGEQTSAVAAAIAAGDPLRTPPTLIS